MISPAEALAIATEAIAGNVEHRPDEPIEVVRRDDRYVVTFVHVNPPGVRGANYDARVTIDAESGEVTEILAGS